MLCITLLTILQNTTETDRILTLWVLQWFSILAAVVHSKHKCIQDEGNDDGHYHLETPTRKNTHVDVLNINQLSFPRLTETQVSP